MRLLGGTPYILLYSFGNFNETETALTTESENTFTWNLC